MRAPTGAAGARWPARTASAGAASTRTSARGGVGVGGRPGPGLGRPVDPPATRTSLQPPAVRSSRSKGRLSSSSLATMTCARRLGAAAALATSGPAPGSAQRVTGAGAVRGHLAHVGQVLGVQGALGGRALDQGPAQGAGADGGGDQDGAGQGAGAGPVLVDQEGVGPPQVVPPPVEGPGQARPEQGPDLGAGHEVAPPPGPSPRLVEAALGVVERPLHEHARTAHRRPRSRHPLRTLDGRPPHVADTRPKSTSACELRTEPSGHGSVACGDVRRSTGRVRGGRGRRGRWRPRRSGRRCRGRSRRRRCRPRPGP